MVSTHYQEPTKITDANVSNYPALSSSYVGYYAISNAGELFWFANSINTSVISVNSNAVLINDIIVSGTSLSWRPIGLSSSKAYTGNFDGFNHSISGISTSSASGAFGVFGYIGTGADIANLGLINAYIKGRGNLSGIVGCISGNDISIVNCYNRGNIYCLDSYYKLGGIAGIISGSNIEIIDCYNQGNIYDEEYYGDIGGLVGTVSGTNISISNCYNKGNISNSGSYFDIGGLVGAVSGTNISISNSYNEGIITSTGNFASFGGIIGSGAGVIVSNCYNSGVIRNDNFSTRCGGIIGKILGENVEVNNCFNMGSVTASNYSGGIVGVVGEYTMKIANCHNAGSVFGSSYVGGLVGGFSIENSQITNCFYLDSKTSSAVGNGTFIGSATSKNEVEFGSGEVTWLLNGGEAQVNPRVWYQTLTGDNKDLCPILNKLHGLVYKGDIYTYNENGFGTLTEDDGYLSNPYIFYERPDYIEDSVNGDYYEITNAGELLWFARHVNQGNVDINGRLANDIVFNSGIFDDNGGYTQDGITATPNSWMIIGNSTYPYKGEFDGCGHTIKGLYAITYFSNQGLFGFCKDSTIKNLGVIDSYISGKNNIGGIVGYGDNVKIENCFNTGYVKADDSEKYIGGIIGRGDNGVQITNCYNTGKIGVIGSGTYVGGIVGKIDIGAQITNCFYLDTTALLGVGNNIGDSTPKSEDEFISGEVAWLLNGGETQVNPSVWYQTLTGDSADLYPVLNNSHDIVYKGNIYDYDENGFGMLEKENSYLSNPYGEYERPELIEDSSNNKYYEITNAGELYWFACHVNSGNVGINGCLTNNIVINDGIFDSDGGYTVNATAGTPRLWVPIGNSSYMYTGKFDGLGHTIKGLYVNNGSDYQGLFGYTVDSIVNNLGIIGGYTKGGTYVGGIAGYSSGAQIFNCYNTGAVAGTDNIGGIVGFADSKIMNCFNTGSISVEGGTYVGELVGKSEAIEQIINCFYLDTATNLGVGNNSEYESSLGEEEFASGKLAWLLNGGETQVSPRAWYQNLTGDNIDMYPVLSNDHRTVYRVSYAIAEVPYLFVSYANGNVQMPSYSKEKYVVTWHADSSCESNAIQFPIVTLTSDAIYYAKTMPIQYTITFNTNGGTSIDVITQDYGTSITAPANPTRMGYTFAGWDIEIPSTMPKENKTINATWNINQYTITFNTNGGTSAEAITQDYGTGITAPANPTKTGYTFAGWDMEIPSTMPGENKTINARWDVNQYTITFNIDNDEKSVTDDYSNTVIVPSIPTKTGYTFVGWDVEVPEAMPAENITVNALWEVNQYTITFVTKSGKVIKTITEEYNSTVEKPTNPKRSGCKFAGWDKEIPLTMPAEDIVVTAKFKSLAGEITAITISSILLLAVTGFAILWFVIKKKKWIDLVKVFKRS